MTLAWVIGGGGLIGSAVRRALLARGAALFGPLTPLRWLEPSVVARQLSDECARFQGLARLASAWEIYWCAGNGTFRSPAHELTGEAQALQALVDALAAPGRSPLSAGGLAFISSAGAVYAGSNDEVITESSADVPTTPYGVAKLAQEQALLDGLQKLPQLAVLLARVSTVYGPGQKASKPQGLISHIARSIVRNQAAHLFVPLDTIRDYIAVDDAADEVIRRLQAVVPLGARSLQIVASERATTISEIIATFRRIARKSARIVITTDPIRNVYARRTQYRSQVSTGPGAKARTSLLLGISSLLADERLRHARVDDVAR